MKIPRASFLLRNPIGVGFVIWLLHLFLMVPFSPYANEQILILLFAAPLFILPLCLRFKGYSVYKLWWILAAAVLFTLAFYFPKGMVGVLLVTPWLLVAANEVRLSWQNELTFSLESIVSMAANIFWLVAAFWAIPDRLGYSPLDYDPVIILLTVVHFHYAGFVLLQLYLMALPNWSKSFGKIIGILLLGGMPLVAIGISSSQVGWPVWIESLTVTVMASAGIGVGLGYVYLGWKNRKEVAGYFWVLSGLCLLVGMSLALLYGWRFHNEYQWLSIPWMYAVHGTFNSMGFALFGVLGWAVSKFKFKSLST